MRAEQQGQTRYGSSPLARGTLLGGLRTMERESLQVWREMRQ